MDEEEYKYLSCATEKGMAACEVEIDRLRRELAFQLARLYGQDGDELFTKWVNGTHELVAQQANAFRQTINRQVNQYEAEHIIPMLAASGKLAPFSVIEGGRQ